MVSWLLVDGIRMCGHDEGDAVMQWMLVKMIYSVQVIHQACREQWTVTYTPKLLNNTSFVFVQLLCFSYGPRSSTLLDIILDRCLVSIWPVSRVRSLALFSRCELKGLLRRF